MFEGGNFLEPLIDIRHDELVEIGFEAKLLHGGDRTRGEDDPLRPEELAALGPTSDGEVLEDGHILEQLELLERASDPLLRALGDREHLEGLTPQLQGSPAGNEP